MAEVLCVYREVALLREAGGDKQDIAILSYDEKPGMQPLGTTAPDLAPVPGKHEGFARDHEYFRHGTLRDEAARVQVQQLLGAWNPGGRPAGVGPA